MDGGQAINMLCKLITKCQGGKDEHTRSEGRD